MGLAEFYKQEKLYSQAIYILFTALEVLPPTRHFKTKASLRIMLGNVLNDQLDYNARLIRGETLKGAPESEIQKLANHMNKKALVFEGVKVHFPLTKLYRTYEEVKELFKMANTEYKKALETYPLDGYVSEHVNILKEISRLYKHLSVLEPDTERRILMELKRKDLIDPVYNTLNPKVYVSLWRVAPPNPRSSASSEHRSQTTSSSCGAASCFSTTASWTSRTRRSAPR
jgi:tetratricopeptide (TPR) repeat protein